jgi:stage V sporulation protein B
MSKQSFIKGTLILLVAGLITRILGFVPRIALPRLIGAEGIGLYQLGWPFLSVILTIVTGGIPLAVSKLVAQAEAEGDERRSSYIRRTALLLATGLSVLFAAICFAAAPWITTHLLTDSRVYYTFVCMTPIIPIIAISAVLRGYFQGKRNMTPSATSSVVETIIRIIAVLVFAYGMLPLGLSYAAAGAMLGVLAGEIAGLGILLLHLGSNSRAVPLKLPVRSPKPKLLRNLLSIAIPVTGSRLVGASSYLFESILIARGLAAAGFATAVATALYGSLQGMVVPILLLPSALTGALSISLIPSLSEAAARKDMITVHARLHQSMRFSLVAGAPFAVIMFVLAEPLCSLLYNQPQAGALLKMMAPIALFIYMQAPLQAALQALDRPGTALFNSLFGAIVKLILIALLVSQPDIGIKGAIIAGNVNIVLVTLLHLFGVKRTLRFSLNAKDVLKVFGAMLVSGVCCHAALHTLWKGNETASFLAAFVISLFVYIGMMFGLKLISRNDLTKLIRLGRKIVKT